MKFVKYESITLVDVDDEAAALIWLAGRFVPREGMDTGQVGSEAWSFKVADKAEDLDASPALSLVIEKTPVFHERF